MSNKLKIKLSSIVSLGVIFVTFIPYLVIPICLVQAVIIALIVNGN